jgi:hypothetical protein
LDCFAHAKLDSKEDFKFTEDADADDADVEEEEVEEVEEVVVEEDI